MFFAQIGNNWLQLAPLKFILFIFFFFSSRRLLSFERSGAQSLNDIKFKCRTRVSEPTNSIWFYYNNNHMGDCRHLSNSVSSGFWLFWYGIQALITNYAYNKIGNCPNRPLCVDCIYILNFFTLFSHSMCKIIERKQMPNGILEKRMEPNGQRSHMCIECVKSLEKFEI